MSAAAWILVVCVGVAMAAPHKVVFVPWKTVSVPVKTVSISHQPVSAPVETVSVNHEPASAPQTTYGDSQEVVSSHQETIQVPLHTKTIVVSPPRSGAVYVKTHDHAAASEAFRNSETFTALDSAGSELARAVGNVASNLGGFLSGLLNTAANFRKQVVVYQPQPKVVVHHAPPPPPTYDDNQRTVFVKTKTVF
ncbi:uncharacterized protein LOC121853774 [Homarus americanus]|uniref:Uncharacterized protein n=1 Tax=Homarus americanus TaxID=6706 RepID=A0A8J5MLY4_HOMAM|nr:uncharacterized protein LOC121853774 [Homarus americanus]KAG7156276.1 hypothetical protein Hamer_G005996 [Homarus americanus]